MADPERERERPKKKKRRSGVRRHPRRAEGRALSDVGVARVECDPFGCVRWMNETAERLSGWPLEMAIGCPLVRVIALTADEDGSLEGLTLESGEGGPLYLQPRGGPRVPVVTSSFATDDGSIFFFRDLNAERLSSLRGARLAQRDPLTDLPDRAVLEERLGAFREEGRAGVLALLEVEALELLEASCGHEAGDRLLQWVAARLREAVRTDDAVARISGGRFGLLLSGEEPAGAERRLRDLREKLHDFRFAWARQSFRVESSVGVVRLSAGSGPSPDEAMAAATDAVGRARSHGGSRVVVHHGDEVHLERRRETLRWLGGLQDHLRSGRVRLFAQPIRPLRVERSGGAHFEILIRPLGQDGTPQSPGGIIAEAERHGLMETVDRWVVEHTLETLSRLPSERLRDVETCAINLSGASLGSESLLEFIVDHFGRTGIAPSRICFEVTETTAVGHVGEVRWLMQELRGMGCRFAIDDFGSGMSSYGYLRDLPVDYLKIDGTFVRSCARDELDRSIVESIVHVARTLSVRTVAEWVDDVPTAELLREVGVDYLQGFEFGRPSPLEEVLGAPRLRSVPPPALAPVE